MATKTALWDFCQPSGVTLRDLMPVERQLSNMLCINVAQVVVGVGNNQIFHTDEHKQSEVY